jgi:hypothetical protein
MKKGRIRVSVLAALIILGIAVSYAVFRFLVVDDCLDAGGRWVDVRCEGARSGE